MNCLLHVQSNFHRYKTDSCVYTHICILYYKVSAVMVATPVSSIFVSRFPCKTWFHSSMFHSCHVDEEIQAAVVCTENLTHEDFAARLLSAGKHVIVEYPAALCERGTRRLFQLAEVNVWEMVGYVNFCGHEGYSNALNDSISARKPPKPYLTPPLLTFLRAPHPLKQPQTTPHTCWRLKWRGAFAMRSPFIHERSLVVAPAVPHSPDTVLFHCLSLDRKTE